MPRRQKKEQRRLQMDSNKSTLFKKTFLIFLPVIIAVLLQYGVMLFDILIIFVRRLFSSERLGSASLEHTLTLDYNQPMNQAYLLLLQYAIFLAVYGLWYKKAFPDRAPEIKTTKRAYMFQLKYLVVAGYMLQLTVDAALALFKPLFPKLFGEYDSMISNVTGPGASLVGSLTVIFIAPAAEEFLFRGLIQNYALGCFSQFFPQKKKRTCLIWAIVLQALLFGLYHGNIIQGIYAFIIGLLLGAIACDHLLPAIVLHMAVNASVFLVRGSWFDTTPRCVILLMGGLIFSTISLYLAIRYKYMPSHQDHSDTPEA